MYLRDDLEYCFINVPIDEAANIVCDATTGSSGEVEATSPQEGLGGSTTEGGAGETSPAGPGGSTAGAGATTDDDQFARGTAAQEAKEQAEKEKKEAEATLAAAQKTATKTTDVVVKIDQVIDSASGTKATTSAAGRVKREATTAMQTFTAPSTCTSFLSMVMEMKAQIQLASVVGFETASNIGTALTEVNPSEISCSANDVAELNTVKKEVTGAAEELAQVIVDQQNEIMVAIQTINDAIEEINEVNAILQNLGQTGFPNPGTTYATVTAPLLPTPGPTEGELGICVKGLK